MSDHNNNGHSSEQKPVSFTVPLILGAITITIFILFAGMGDSCHHEALCAAECSQECKDACAKGDHSKHPEGMSMEACHGKDAAHGECSECKDGKECAHHGAKAEEAAVAATDSAVVTEPTAEPVKEEAHH